MKKSKERKRLFWVWSDMRGRCTNRNHAAYKNYGGRGISVCGRWQSFDTFLADMSPRPAGYMLDREDNNAGYSPENCRWVDRKTQNSNRRNCIYVDDGGEIVTLRELCRRRCLNYRPIVKRVQNRGWTIQEAIETPIGQRLFDRQGNRIGVLQ